MSQLLKRANKYKAQLHNNQDVIIRDLGDRVIIFIDGISDIKEIDLNIIGADCDTNIAEKTIAKKDSEIIDALLVGKTALLTEGQDYILSTTKYEYRAVNEPPTSVVIRGPREGFNESIKTNISLIRKRLASPNLVIKDFVAGKETKTKIKVLYLNNIVDKNVVKMLLDRLSKIDIDGVVDSYYIEKLISDKPCSLFKQVGQCEKPDIVVAKMLEGRIAIVVDGSPIVLTLPYLLIEDLQSSNDYYSNNIRASLARVVRLVGAFTAILVPGIYLALLLYHYEIIPLKFLVTIINTTQNLPLSPFLEIFFIVLLFEILFEASVRMPKYLGVAISIVGALILGDTAVKAGLVSPPGVMVVAISAITIYSTPDQSDVISVLRIVFTFLGGAMGLIGVIGGAIVMISYLCNHASFGVAYLAPYSPFIPSDQKDFILKYNITKQKTRPMSFVQKNKKRLKYGKDN